MDDLVRIGAAAQALGVSVDTLRRWEREGRVQFERPRQQPLPEGRGARGPAARAGASDRSSARNRLHGVVLEVKRDGVMAQVDMACGPYRIVSLMSAEAADELDLKPGDPATAVVKATTVVVERP